jgi:YVTN family beta-propeller protein
MNKTGTELFITSGVADVVYRISTIGGAVLSTIIVPGRPDGISIEADGETMWISQSEFGSVIKAKSVDVVNEEPNELTNTTTITVGDHPAASVLSSDGKYLFVTDINDGTLSRINTQTSLVTPVMRVGAEPNAIALDEANNVAIVAYRFGNSIGQVTLPALPAPTPAAPVVETPVAPKPNSSVQAPAKSSVAPAVSLKKPVSNKSIVSYSKLVVAKTSKVVVKVAQASAKYCKMVGTSVKALKVGSCKVTVTVTPKKGKPTSKTVTLKVTK